jgi:hypothetical protein
VTGIIPKGRDFYREARTEPVILIMKKPYPQMAQI